MTADAPVEPGHAGALDVDVFFAGVAVTDFDAARTWYEHFFGRAPDVVAHETEVMWRVTQRGWLYILRDVADAGHGIVSISVPDIDAASSALGARGIALEPIEAVGDAGRKAVASDPDGNQVAIIEVTNT